MPEPDYQGFAQNIATQGAALRQGAYNYDQGQYTDFANKMAGRELASGNNAAAAQTLGATGNIGAAQSLYQAAQGQAGLAAAAQGDVMGARAAGAQTGNPTTYGQLNDAAVQSAGQRIAAVVNTAQILKGIQAQPGESDASVQSRRATALQQIAQSGAYAQTGTSPEAVQAALQGPLDDQHIDTVTRAAVLPFSGMVNKDQRHQNILGQVDAEGYHDPVFAKPGDAPLGPDGKPIIAQQVPALPSYSSETTPAGPVSFNKNTGQFGSAGAPSPSPASASQVMPGGANQQGVPNSSQTLGDRSNNPGNIQPSPTGTWQGQTGVNSQGYSMFDTPQNGARAMDLNLAAYQNHGATTPRQIVARWASTSPPDQQAAYAARIAQAAGVGLDTPLNLADPAVRAQIEPAMARSEGTHLVTGTPSGPTGAPTPAAAGQQGGAPGLTIAPDGRSVSVQAYAPATQYGLKGQRQADGSFTPTAGASYGVEQMEKARNDFADSTNTKDATAAINAVNSINRMIQGATANNGVLDMAAFNNLAKAETGGVSRISTVNALMSHLGAPQELMGRIDNLLGNGAVTPQSLGQVIDTIRAYATTKRSVAAADAANRQQFASAHGGGDLMLSPLLPAITPTPNVPWLNGGGQQTKAQPPGQFTAAQIQAEMRRRGLTH